MDKPTEPEAIVSSFAEERAAPGLLPIVGIGASAGGLEAFTQLLAHLPAQTGMAFVLVQHLDPHHESRLTDLLAAASRMPVVEASHALVAEPDHVYVIAPNTSMAIAHGVLQVTPRGEVPGLHLPLDYFLRSLAQTQQAQAIGVVLSGTGADGTLGLLEIKAAGGITFAQEPGSARHDGMPQSAIQSGAVDFVLSPEGIARRLAELGAHRLLTPGALEERQVDSEDDFARVLRAVRVATGVDFSQYRDSTIRRRILRRMALHAESSLASYAERLPRDMPEVEALYKDLLINVTSFFRDPALFEALKTDVFPQILKTKAADAPLRLWVAGCSSGQEAYSLAIALWEFFDDEPVRHPFLIFSTDLSDIGTLARARAGLYPASIEAEVTPERLRRFFKQDDHHHYRIDKAIRDCCVFARQNLTVDPPFSNVDFVSCRNVLIYMAPMLQRRVLSTLHYALNVPGFLVLGSSETVGASNGLFEATDRTNKIYAKKITSSRPLVPVAVADYKQPGASGPAAHARGSTPSDFQREADRLLLSRYAPPGVLVNEHFDILHFRGHTGPYLEAPSGQPTMSLLKMARPGLLVELRDALREAVGRGEVVRREGIVLREAQTVREVTIEVLPLRPRDSPAQCCLVLFEEDGGSEGTPPRIRPGAGAARWMARFFGWAARNSASEMPPPTLDPGETEQLRQELSSTREYMQSLVEQQDTANEGLRSANEEVLSANEELQSTNEELETAKEELQSTNEELTTVNEQLQQRNLELNQTTNDLQNLLASTSIPVVMVGPDLRIRRVTPPARKIMNLLPTDLGRSIGDLKANVDVADLEALVTEVIGDVQPREREVLDRDGRRYILRIHPYRTTDNKIDGAVLVLLDIEDLKRSEEQAREARDYAQAIIATVREPLLVLDDQLRIRTANTSYYRTFQVAPEEVEGHMMFDLGERQWNVPALRALLEEVLPRGEAFDDFEVQCSFPRIGLRTMLLNGRSLRRADRPASILLAIEDISARKQIEAALRISEERLSLAIHGTGMGTWDLDLATGKAICSETHFRILGYEPTPDGQALVEMWHARIHADDREGVLQAIEEAKRARARYAMEYRILRADDGETRWLSVFGRFVYAESGEATRFVGILLDVTERRRETEALSYQASHDPLTGLTNRAELERRLGRVLASADVRDPHALLYLDLDQFKLVNDTCGHAAGDALLRQLPAVLKRHLRKRDTLARLGGDEFGVLLEHCSEAQALRVANQLVEDLRAFRFAWEDKEFSVGASVGLVAIPAGGETLATVMSAADRACYAAKDKGRNRVHVYEVSDQELQQRDGEMRWIPRLRRALEEDRFLLYAQPVVALTDHSADIEYHEVLLRLQDEQAGLLLPHTFIAAAERYQQMGILDRWVVRAALSHLAAPGNGMHYGINLSAQSLSDATFLDFVLGLLDTTRVGPGRVVFEITETAVITDLKHALRFMHAIKERGCRFALDDFGSGLASFGYLKTLPVDYLKIDGRFVRGIPRDSFDDAVVQAVQGIAQTLGLRTIAESVESEAILERVRAIGVDCAQGYAIATPEPLLGILSKSPVDQARSMP